MAVNLQCAVCGCVFIYKIKQGPAPKYCSYKCKALAWPSRIGKSLTADDKAICIVCGVMFQQKRRNQIVCSQECRRIRDNQTKSMRRRKIGEFNCRNCGKFYIVTHGDKRRAYCSESCYMIHRKKIINDRSLFLCERIDRDAIFERDGWRCHICGKKTQKRLRGTSHSMAPELDHIMPLSLGGNHMHSNVACACRSCNLKKRARPYGQLSLFPIDVTADRSV